MPVPFPGCPLLFLAGLCPLVTLSPRPCSDLAAPRPSCDAATFVDFSPVCAQAIRDNAQSVGLADRATVLQARVDTVLQTPEAFGITKPFELVTLTPPYEEVS